jgi:hypothetical protein
MLLHNCPTGIAYKTRIRGYVEIQFTDRIIKNVVVIPRYSFNLEFPYIKPEKTAKALLAKVGGDYPFLYRILIEDIQYKPLKGCSLCDAVGLKSAVYVYPQEGRPKKEYGVFKKQRRKSIMRYWKYRS